MKNKAIFCLIFLLAGNWPSKSSASSDDTSVPPPPYHIEVSVSQRRLFLHEKQGESLNLLKEYKVETAKQGLDEIPLGRGYITKIEFNPTWWPTAAR